MSHTPNVKHIISTANSTTTLLGAAGTFTGAWEEVIDWTTVAVAVIGTITTDGTLFIESSQDGGTVVNSVAYVIKDATFDLPKVWNIVETHIRIRYVNGTTPQTGAFQIQTKYSNGQELGVLHTIDEPIDGKATGKLVKAVLTGADPNGNFTNFPTAGYIDNLTTQSTLAGAASFAPADCIFIDGFAHVSIEILSDQDGTFVATWYTDSACTDLIRTFTLPYFSTAGFVFAAAPVFGKYFKIVYTNGATPQTDFHLGLKLLTDAVGSFVLGLNDFVPTNAVANITRSIAMGKDPNEIFINTPGNGIDNNNTTVTPLGISGVFTGAWSRVDLYGEIKVSYTSDEDAADCQLQLSHDGITVHSIVSVPPQPDGSEFSAIHTLNPSLPYFRVVYTNGAIAQTSFLFTTILLVNTGNGFISRATQIVNKFNDIKFIRAINSPELDRNLGLINYQTAEKAFGTNESVPNTSFETIWAGAHLGGAGVYVFPQAAEGFRVKAGGNAADTNTGGAGARTVEITFLDANWNETVEVLDLAGASVSASTSAQGYRVLKVEILTTGTYGGSNTGVIVIENDSTNLELAYVEAEAGKAVQAIYTVPSGKTAYIKQIFVSVGQGNSADVRLFKIHDADVFAAPFGTKHIEWSVEDFSGANIFDLDTYLVAEEKSDIFIDAERVTGSGDATISAGFEITLVDN